MHLLLGKPQPAFVLHTIAFLVEVLCSQSYAFTAGYRPSVLNELAESLFIPPTYYDETPDESDPNLSFRPGFETLGQDINNMIVKLGFMLLARDYVKEINGTSKHSYIWVNYHFNSFVFSSKAFLDSVAVILNNEYKLGFSRGEIELSRGVFVDVLAKKNASIANLIRNEKKWIGEVVKWRTALIHKLAAAVVPMNGDPGPDGDHLTHIPMEPFASFDIPSYQRINLKHGKLGQEILPFCQEWIGKSQQLFETVCAEITSQYIIRGG